MPARMWVVKVLAGILSAAVLAASGCSRPDTYVVKSVADKAELDGTVRVVCWVKDTDKTWERQWDPLVQIAPEVGEKWLCN